MWVFPQPPQRVQQKVLYGRKKCIPSPIHLRPQQATWRLSTCPRPSNSGGYERRTCSSSHLQAGPLLLHPRHVHHSRSEWARLRLSRDQQYDSKWMDALEAIAFRRFRRIVETLSILEVFLLYLLPTAQVIMNSASLQPRPSPQSHALKFVNFNIHRLSLGGIPSVYQCNSLLTVAIEGCC